MRSSGRVTAFETRSVVTDVLVIGGGVAALRAAIAAREAGADVLVCCKGIAGRSGNTVVSTADISAYLPGQGADDSADIFAQDTLDTGAGIGDEQLIRILADHSGHAVLDLERLGIRLLRAGGQIDRTRAAGHSRARTYRADSEGLGPNKGLALSIPLADRARTLGVDFLDRTPVIHLEASDKQIVGAVAVAMESGVVLSIGASAVILGAGGAAHLFARTNGTADAAGDGIAIALRAGCLARDLEFVQWHPTRMDAPVPLFLTNGLLADGAVLRDVAGREFMGDYDARGSLAPRDVLAKAAYIEAASGRGIAGGVYLDCSAIPDDRIALRHAYLAETLQKHGVDFPREWLVVSPSTHFLMGGIAISPDASSSLSGLYAVGESAGGIHGANRLGGNAFCEGLVFGTIAGQASAAFARAATVAAPPNEVGSGLRRHLNPAAPDVRDALRKLWQRVRDTMWLNASVVRDASGLTRAAADLEGLAAEAAALRCRSVSDAARILELGAGLDCARAIVAAALVRKESRGAHWRRDFPDTSDAWLGSISVAWPQGVPEPSLHFVPKIIGALAGS